MVSDSNQGNILITGATGNVGFEIVKQLSAPADRNTRLRAAVRSINDAVKVIGQRAELVEMDYSKPDSLSKAINGINKLFLLTPFEPNMVELSSNLISEAKKAGTVKHIVKQSVMGADAEPRIIPSRLHRQVERIIEESGIPFTFLRPNFFMQNFINFLGNTIRNQNALYLPAGEGKVSFVDVRDIAAVAAKILVEDDGQHKGKSYNITGPEALSYGDAALILSNELGKKITYVNISDEDARNGMRAMGLDKWFIDSMIELYDISRKGYASDISSAVEHITGRKSTSFSQFVKENIGSFM
ncbi:MAG: SDR family oxidoreductase [Candidatus Nitrosopolaris sp.]